MIYKLKRITTTYSTTWNSDSEEVTPRSRDFLSPFSVLTCPSNTPTNVIILEEVSSLKGTKDFSEFWARIIFVKFDILSEVAYVMTATATSDKVKFSEDYRAQKFRKSLIPSGLDTSSKINHAWGWRVGRAGQNTEGLQKSGFSE